MDHRLGFRLEESTQKLIGEVEKSFGSPVIVKRRLDWEASHYGEAYVDSEGHPTIELNATTGLTNANVAHELMHLLMKSKGYMQLAFEFPKGKGTAGNQEWMRWLSFHLRDPIQHSIFYPEMRKRGIELGREVEKEFRDLLATGEFPKLNEASRFEALVLYYLKARIEITSPGLLASVDELYKAKWVQEEEMGRRIFDVMRQEDAKSPEKEIQVFVDCANMLLRDRQRVQLKIVGYESMSKGTFTERIAVISIGPL